MSQGADELYEILADIGITFEGCAAALGVEKSTVTRLFQGSVPKLDLAVKIEERYGVPHKAWLRPSLRARS